MLGFKLSSAASTQSVSLKSPGGRVKDSPDTKVKNISANSGWNFVKAVGRSNILQQKKWTESEVNSIKAPPSTNSSIKT